MALLIYGSQKTSIGIFEPLFYKCPNCDELHTTYLVVYSIYYHIFWIPVFPYEKEAIANCSACSFLRNEINFGYNLIKEFEEKRKDFKHPWWTYTLSVIFSGIIIALIVTLIH
jgi:MFS-type transporter involved in bile tolerance (Atg22 family)